ncbi:MAG TPA: Stp1/IreP family PP2C-type Ser/Thr phosphatase [Actinomycetota bacterium]|nr:Stp1/IreP family PP2C-type Ser/Thr phosphatase [Actinomycetota bacterium]
MKLRAGASTDVGLVRQRNEDAYVADYPLFAVADGLGGHLGGEVASRVAVDILTEQAKGDGPDEGIPDRLRSAIQRANAEVSERASNDQSLTGMGTTITAVIAGHDRVFLGHVGDSRAYLLRDGELRALTEDHSLVQRMVREGRLTPEQAEIHPQRSVLTRALGIDDDLEVDQATVEVTAGDRLLLCSDGLTSMVADELIRKILTGHDDPQAASQALVEAANGAGGQDNITTVVLDVQEAAEPAPAQPADAAAREAPSRDWTARPARRGRRLAVMIGVPVLLVAALLVGARMYLDRQWFVGIHDDNVSLFRGIPTEVLGLNLSTLVEETEIPVQSAEQLQTWRDIADGITAGSEAEAREIMAQIQSDVGPGPYVPASP